MAPTGNKSKMMITRRRKNNADEINPRRGVDVIHTQNSRFIQNRFQLKTKRPPAQEQQEKAVIIKFETDIDHEQDSNSEFLEDSSSPVTSGKVRCTQCPELFQSLANMLSHEVGHGPNFQCSLCSAWFNKESGLACHKRRFHHTNNGSESLTSSPSSSSRSSSSQQEPAYLDAQKPTKKKPNRIRKICQICQISFRDTTSLKSHLRSHYGERPFLCRHCLQTYTRRSILRGHLRRAHGILDSEMTAEELKPISQSTTIYQEEEQEVVNPVVVAKTPEEEQIAGYKCSQCPELFLRLSACEAHFSDHGSTYICPVCKAGFAFRSKFELHMRKFHKRKVSTVVVEEAVCHNNQEEDYEEEDQYYEEQHEEAGDQEGEEEEEMLVYIEDLRRNDCVIVADESVEMNEEEEDDEGNLFICEDQVLL